MILPFGKWFLSSCHIYHPVSASQLSGKVLQWPSKYDTTKERLLYGLYNITQRKGNYFAMAFLKKHHTKERFFFGLQNKTHRKVFSMAFKILQQLTNLVHGTNNFMKSLPKLNAKSGVTKGGGGKLKVKIMCFFLPKIFEH